MTAAALKKAGRPRSAKARQAVLRAAQELLDEGGLGAVTMERLAQRAGVGKPTIYRSFSNREEVAMAALTPARENSPFEDNAGDPIAGLRAQLKSIAELFTSARGRNIARMLAAADQDTEISRAFRSHFITSRRKEGELLLVEARTALRLRPDADIGAVLDLLYGALFYRLLIGHEPLTIDFMESIVDTVLEGIAK